MESVFICVICGLRWVVALTFFQNPESSIEKTRANARVFEVLVRLAYEAVFLSAVSRSVEACMAVS